MTTGIAHERLASCQRCRRCPDWPWRCAVPGASCAEGNWTEPATDPPVADAIAPRLTPQPSPLDTPENAAICRSCMRPGCPNVSCQTCGGDVYVQIVRPCIEDPPRW